jgi:hypothetical protein
MTRVLCAPAAPRWLVASTGPARGIEDGGRDAKAGMVAGAHRGQARALDGAQLIEVKRGPSMERSSSRSRSGPRREAHLGGSHVAQLAPHGRPPPHHRHIARNRGERRAGAGRRRGRLPRTRHRGGTGRHPTSPRSGEGRSMRFECESHDLRWLGRRRNLFLADGFPRLRLLRAHIRSLSQGGWVRGPVGANYGWKAASSRGDPDIDGLTVARRSSKAGRVAKTLPAEQSTSYPFGEFAVSFRYR